MAASEAKRDVVYFTFGDERLQTDIASLHALITRNKVTVGQVECSHTHTPTLSHALLPYTQMWSALVRYSSYRTRRDRPSLHSYLHTTLGAPPAVIATTQPTNTV